MVKSNNVAEASFKIAWNIAKANKPATEGEFLKTAFVDCTNSLFSDFKNKEDIIKPILKLQVSDSTVIRRIEVISDNILSQLLKDIESAAFSSLALDESTDRTDIAHLVVWVRFPKGDTFPEEMLALMPLTGQTRGQDIHSALISFFRGPGKTINLKNLVSMTTNGAASIIGKEKGVLLCLEMILRCQNFSHIIVFCTKNNCAANSEVKGSK